MVDNGANIRSPFRPLQQSIHLNKSRLKDSPMDFSYDSPRHEHALSSSASWLDKDEDKKRPRETLDGSEVFSFGSNDATTGTSGAFLFHQPLAPTISGPDVEMSSETSPIRLATESSRLAPERIFDENSSRPLASSGALTRVTRNRGVGGKRGTGTSEQKKSQSTSHSKSRRKAKAKVQEGDWEDDEVEETGEQNSLWRRTGDTTNIQYVFGGGPAADSEKKRHSSWLDPEWCLGMAQVTFNAILLLGVLYLFYGVIRTLQRDVSDKVREYELEFLSEIEACSHSYHLNKCGTEGAVPALASACASWQKCSAKDPAIVGRARVAAETVAEIVNGFVDVVSWKSMVFTLLSLVIIVGATNSTLSFFRLKSRKAQSTPLQSMNNDHFKETHYDPQSIHPAYRSAAMYNPYSSHWHASPPPTPSSKRMCR